MGRQLHAWFAALVLVGAADARAQWTSYPLRLKQHALAKWFATNGVTAALADPRDGSLLAQRMKLEPSWSWYRLQKSGAALARWLGQTKIVSLLTDPRERAVLVRVGSTTTEWSSWGLEKRGPALAAWLTSNKIEAAWVEPGAKALLTRKADAGTIVSWSHHGLRARGQAFAVWLNSTGASEAFIDPRDNSVFLAKSQLDVAAFVAGMHRAHARYQRSIGGWPADQAMLEAVAAFNFEGEAWSREIPNAQATLEAAERVAASKDPSKLSTATLARALFLLEVDGRGRDRALANRLSSDARALVAGELDVLKRLYAPPCARPLRRVNRTWPPSYACDQPASPPSAEPTPPIVLARAPALIAPPGEPDKKTEDVKLDGGNERRRRRELATRDAALVDSERIAGPLPSRFCVRGDCRASYREVAALLYPGSASDHLPVFCAPARRPDGAFERDRVECSSNWLDTWKGWAPWDKEGAPTMPRRDWRPPPFACLGSPHLLASHMVLPSGGEIGGGFRCRNRVFRVQVKKVERNLADARANIVQMCAKMRFDVWGDKDPRINERYKAWCLSPRGPKDKTLCPKPDEELTGAAGESLPFFRLTREELLFFFGHAELYCRANRGGLVHFLDNDKWTSDFDCGVARGVIESGPFEEGVQTCAVAPFVGDEPSGGVGADDLKARLHCWKFRRPTCEEISDPVTAEKKDSLWRSNVFDTLDALKEARRTHDRRAWQFYDLKDAGKLSDHQDASAFTDGSDDEGEFGVKKFCRFVGNLKTIRCGYDKASLARWYELRADEPAEGCATGICARGAYARGYYCALFNAPDSAPNRADGLFAGEPFWMCGIDVGEAGRKLLARSRAVCQGGAPVKGFLSSRGDKGSLQCYERRFRWGESQRTEGLLRSFDWAKAVREAARRGPPRYEPWLHGGTQAKELVQRIYTTNWQRLVVHTAGWVGRGDSVCGVFPKEKLARAGTFVLEKCGYSYEYRNMDALTSKQRPGWATARPGETDDGWNQRVGSAIAATATRALFEAETKTVAQLAKDTRGDVEDLIAWARKHGHTLGHRTSLRQGLLRSDLPLIRRFRTWLKDRFRRTKTLEFTPYGSSYPKYAYHKEDERDGDPIDDPKAKELNGLVEEILKEGRAADDKWYQAFRLAATEGGQLRVPPATLAAARRVNYLFEVLEGARAILLKHASLYALSAFQEARRAPLMTRLELHERARAAGIDSRFKDAVFCVEDPFSRNGRGLPDYVCASSPLLVAGAVEQSAERRLKSTPRLSLFEKTSERRKEKIRARVKMGWCYGGTAGRYLYGKEPSRALSEPDLSSPFFMDVPAAARDDLAPRPGGRSTLDRRRPLQRLAGRGVDSSEAPDLDRTHLSAPPRARAPKKMAASLNWAAIARALAKAQREAGLELTAAQRRISKAHYLRCNTLAYSDENWADADPRLEPTEKLNKARPSATASQDGDASAEDRQSAERKGEDIVKSIGGFLGQILDLVAPGFSAALKQIEDVVHMGQELYEKYVKKFVVIAQAIFKGGEQTVNPLEEARKALEGDLKQGEKDLHDAELRAAAATGKAKELADEKVKRLSDKLTELRKGLTGKTAELKSQLAGIQRQLKIPASLFTELTSEIVGLATERVMKLIEPHGKRLFTKGFSYVRKLLGYVVKPVLKAIAAIPFAGPVLTAIAQELYEWGMGQLEELGGQKLVELMERLLGKGIRALVAPAVGFAKQAIAQLATVACRTLGNPAFCPSEVKFAALPKKDRWLERALACGGGRRLLDEAELERRAALARVEMIRRARGMERDALAFARGVADRYLARFGYSYDGWMAAMGGPPSPDRETLGEAVRDGLRKLVDRMRAERQRSPNDG